MTDERRLYSRIAFQSPARLVYPDRSIGVVVVDLSLKGALIRLPASTSIAGESIGVLHVELTEDGEQIRMQTRAAHVEGRNVGLVCVTLDIDSVTHLRRLVELNLGDPALLEREWSALIAE
jgi:hypothetical protein